MSAGDYTALRRFRQMQSLSCNTIPGCHYTETSESLIPNNNAMSNGCYSNCCNNAVMANPSCSCRTVNNCCGNAQQRCLGNQVAQGCCNGGNNLIVATAATNGVNLDASGNCLVTPTSNKHFTQTKKAYNVVPTKNGTVGFLVDKCLPFEAELAVSCKIVDSPSNYFNGKIFDYDKETGFLSIGNIDCITGTFSGSVKYDVYLVLFDPEVEKLKERMLNVYQSLYNIDLDATPNYDPFPDSNNNNNNNNNNTSVDLTVLEPLIFNVLMYLFNYNIRIDPAYSNTTTFLSSKIDELYLYLFNITLSTNASFNPNGRNVSLTNLQNKVYEIYYYLFNVDLATTTITLQY
jgi:hypothetical protein